MNKRGTSACLDEFSYNGETRCSSRQNPKTITNKSPARYHHSKQQAQQRPKGTGNGMIKICDIKGGLMSKIVSGNVRGHPYRRQFEWIILSNKITKNQDKIQLQLRWNTKDLQNLTIISQANLNTNQSNNDTNLPRPKHNPAQTQHRYDRGMNRHYLTPCINQLSIKTRRNMIILVF